MQNPYESVPLGSARLGNVRKPALLMGAAAAAIPFAWGCYLLVGQIIENQTPRPANTAVCGMPGLAGTMLIGLVAPFAGVTTSVTAWVFGTIWQKLRSWDRSAAAPQLEKSAAE